MLAKLSLCVKLIKLKGFGPLSLSCNALFTAKYNSFFVLVKIEHTHKRENKKIMELKIFDDSRDKMRDRFKRVIFVKVFLNSIKNLEC